MVRNGGLVLVGVVVLAAVCVAGLAAGVAAAEDVTVNATVTPESPSVAEPTRFDVTVESGADDVEVEAIEIVDRQSSATYERVEFGGDDVELDENERETIPVTATFEESGPALVGVRVEYSQDHLYTETVETFETVVVTDERPQLDVEVNESLVRGEYSTVNVTVANTRTSAIRRLAVALDGEGVEVNDPERSLHVLAAESEHTFEFQVKALRSGEHRVTGTLSMVTDNGYATVRDSTTASTEEPEWAVLVDYSVDGSGPNAALDVEVANGGNAVLRRAEVALTSSGEVLSREYLGDLRANERQSVRLGAVGVTAPVRLRVAYVNESGRQVTEREVPGSVLASRLELTSLSVSDTRSGTLQISGHASNVGLVDAEGVVVEVVRTEGVEPAEPAKRYFVGTVSDSEFVAFDVYASADADVESVPLRVTYIQNGEEHSHRHSVPIARSDGGGGGGGGLSPLTIAAVLLSFVILVGLAFTVYENT